MAGNAKKVAVYSVRIDCGGCERTLAKALAKIHGVEMFVMDRNNNTLQVTGQIDEKEVLKKLKKKRKRKPIQLISVKEIEEPHENTEEEEEEKEDKELEVILENPPRTINDLYAHHDVVAYQQNRLCNSLDEAFMMFDDENPSSCSVM